MTTLLQPLLTRSLWLDVLRQVVSGVVRSLDRVTDSFDVFVRILMAAAGVALSSVLLLAIYPVLPGDIQFFALVITGFVWYLSLAQIQPGHDTALLSYFVYLAALVPVTLALIAAGVQTERLYALVADATRMTFTEALAIYIAIRLCMVVINAFVWTFTLDTDERDLVAWEKNALQIAKANLTADATWRSKAVFAVQGLASAFVGVWLLSVAGGIAGPLGFVPLITGLVLVQLGAYAIAGLLMVSDRDVNKTTLRREPRPTFKRRLKSYEPLSQTEQEALRRFRRFDHFAGWTFVASLLFLLVYPFLSYHYTAALVIAVTAPWVWLVGFIGALAIHSRVKKNFEAQLIAARAS